MIEQLPSCPLHTGIKQDGSSSDGQLMAAVAEGDCAALEQLYDRHVSRCYGLALQIVRDPSTAEDIVQEVFTKLWSQPGNYSPERGRFGSWLSTVVRNRALDKLRNTRRRSERHIIDLDVESTSSDIRLDKLPDVGPNPHDQVWANDTAIVVRQALSQLPPPQLQAITLAYFGGLSQQEVATKLNKPLGTVKTQTRSALRTLRELLKSQGLL
jgi:RNA polymerase sigma-70 factor, ECF subfamily